MKFPLAIRRAGRRPATASFAMAIVLAAGLATSGATLAGAQTRAEDLPPPPGALERELSLGPLEKAAAGATGGGQQLASPIDIPFILEGGHIIVAASIDDDTPRPFLFDTGAMNVITPAVA